MRLLLALLLFSTACVTTAQEGEQMRKDIAGLKKEEEAQAQGKAELAQDNAKRAQQLQDALDQLNRASRKSGADLAVDLEKTQNDLAAVHGLLEVLQHKVDAIEQANAERDRKLDENGKFVATHKSELDKAEHPADRMGIYVLAKRKLDDGQLLRSRELFGDFLAKFKGDELAANAQYWLGETYYADKRYNDAIVEFQKVLKEHKGSEKAPDALLKIGMSFQAEHDCKNALLFYEEVLTSHKSTAAAKVAREKQAECRKGRGAK